MGEEPRPAHHSSQAFMVTMCSYSSSRMFSKTSSRELQGGRRGASWCRGWNLSSRQRHDVCGDCMLLAMLYLCLYMLYK